MALALAVGRRAAQFSATHPLRTLLGRVAAFLGLRGLWSRSAVIDNPYVIDRPVDNDEDFIGRRLVLDRAHRSLPNNSLFLSGERSIGKTSVLLSLQRSLTASADPQWRFVPIYTDLAHAAEEDLFPVLERSLSAAVETLGGRPAPPLRPGMGSPHRDLVLAIRRAIDELSLALRRPLKLVFLLDGIDTLNSFDPRVNQRLRSVFMTDLGEHLRAVVAGSFIDRTWEVEGSPWYNFFEELELGPMPRWEAEELVLRPASGRFHFDPAAVQAIIDLGACHPDRIQRICHRLAHAALARGGAVITVDAVRQLAKQAHDRR